MAVKSRSPSCRLSVRLIDVLIGTESFLIVAVVPWTCVGPAMSVNGRGSSEDIVRDTQILFAESVCVPVCASGTS